MLTDKQLKGEVLVTVLNRNGQNKVVIEGEATIIEVTQGDRQGVHARVKFEDDIDGAIYGRWVFASDQPNDENYKPLV